MSNEPATEEELGRLRVQLLKTGKALRQLRIKHSEVMSRIPRNGDGDPVFHTDTVWMWDADTEKPIWGVVHSIDETGDEGEYEFFGFMPDEELDFTAPNKHCYSSSESCRRKCQETKGRSND